MELVLHLCPALLPLKGTRSLPGVPREPKPLSKVVKVAAHHLGRLKKALESCIFHMKVIKLCHNWADKGRWETKEGKEGRKEREAEQSLRS